MLKLIICTELPLYHMQWQINFLVKKINVLMKKWKNRELVSNRGLPTFLLLQFERSLTHSQLE